MIYTQTFRLLLCALPIAALFCSCSAKNRTNPPDTIADKLIACNVLEAKDRNTLEQNLEDESPTAVIEALIIVRYSKHGVEGNNSFRTTTIIYDTAKYRPEQMEAAVEGVKRFLDGLHTCQVVNDNIYDKYITEIQSHRYIDPLQLLEQLKYDVKYADLLTSERFRLCADTLHAAGVLTDKRFNDLKQDIEAQRITLHYQLLDYVEHGVYFDLSKYSSDPKDYLPAIYSSIAGLFPELAFTDFEFDIVENKQWTIPDFKATGVIVSFKVNGVEYKHKSFISMPSGKDDGYLGFLDQHEFYHIFNHVLIDHGSPYRLHVVPSTLEFFPGNYQYFGILALREEQQYMLESLYPVFGWVAPEPFGKAITSHDIRIAIEKIRLAHFVDHLSQDQVDSVGQEMRVQRPVDMKGLLGCFPHVVYSLATDLPDPDHPYEKILDKLSHISRGAFKVQNVRVNFITGGTSARVTFLVNGKSYSTDVRTDVEVDPDFFTFAIKSAAEQNSKGKFYNLSAVEDAATYIYLTPPQARLLQLEYSMALD